jgi:phosphoribosylglycinamide formyltransferase-1
MTSHNIVVLISGRGSNLQAVLETANVEQWQARLGAHVAAVISNRADANGLAVARAHGIPTAVVDHAQHGSRPAFEAALIREIDRHAPSLVVLAGFMRVLTASFVQRYATRLINIHPSLLPLFPGLNTHRQALAAGVRVHGATVHYVSESVDDGAIIAQAVVPVHPGDDEATLAARVLQQEHRLLPRAIRLIVEGRAAFDGVRVVLRDVAAVEVALLAP